MAFTGMSDNTVEVVIQGESSGLEAAAANAREGLLSVRQAAGVAGAALSAMATGALASATSAAADFEDAMVGVEKVTDPQTAREMSAAIRDMASEIPVAQEELAGIAEIAGRLGIEGSTNIRTFTRVVSEMATATDLTAQEAADSFARMTTLMDEPIENVRSLGDVINELGNTMAASASEITNSATRSAGVLTQLGLSSQEILGLNAAMNEVSASSRIAGTQLRRFAQEITDPRKVSDLAGAIGMTTEEFKQMRSANPNELILQMAEAFGQGGEQAEAMNSVLGNTSRQTLAKLSQNLDSVRTAQQRANQQFADGGSLADEFDTAVSTFNSQLQILRNNLQNNAIAIGNVLLPHLSDLLERVNDLLTNGDSLINRLSAQETAFTLVATAVGGAAVALAAFATGPIVATVAAVGTLTAAIGGLSAAFATNFAGIRSSTDVVLSQLRTEFRETFAVLQDVTDTDLTAITSVFGAESGNWENIIGERLGRLTTTVQEGLMRMGDAVRGSIRAMDQAWTAHGATITSVAGTIVSTIASALSSVRTLVEITLSTIQSQFDQTFPYLRQLVTVVMADIRSVFGTELAAVRSRVETGLGRVTGVFEMEGGEWPLIVGELIGRVTTVVHEGIMRLGQRVRSGLQTTTALWEAHGEGVLTAVRSAYTQVTSAVGRVLDRLHARVGLVLNDLLVLWDEHGEAAIQTVRTGYGSVETEIRTAAEAGRDAVGRVTGRIVTLWDEHGTTVKSNLSDAYASVESTLSDAIEDAKPLVNTALGEVEAFWSEHESTVIGAADDLKVGVLDAFGDLEEGVSALAEGDWQTAVEKLWDAVDGVMDEIRTLLVGEGGDGGIVITGLRELGEWLENNAGDVIEGGFEIIADVASDKISNLRFFLVGEDGSSGIINTMLEEATGILNAHAGSTWAEAWETLDSVARSSMNDLKIALIGEGEGGGLIDTIIGSIGSFLKGGGKDIVREGWEDIGTAVRLVVEDLAKAVIGSDDSIVKSTLSEIASYLTDDAWGDLKDAQQTLNGLWLAAWEGFKDGIMGPEDSLMRTLISDIESYLLQGAANTLKLATRDGLVNAMQEVWREFRDWLIGNSFIQDTINEVATWVEVRGRFLLDEAFGAVISRLRSTWEDFKTWIWNTFFPGLFDAVSGWLTSTGKSIMNSAFGEVVGAIGDALNGIDLSGISDALEGIIDKAKNAIDWVKDVPSKKTVEIVIEDQGRGERGVGNDWTLGGGGGDSGGIDDSNVGDGSTGGLHEETRRSSGGFHTTGGFAQGGIVSETGLGLLHGGITPEAVVPLDKLEPLMAGAIERVTADASGGGGPPNKSMTVVVRDNEFHGVEDADGVADALVTEIDARF